MAPEPETLEGHPASLSLSVQVALMVGRTGEQAPVDGSSGSVNMMVSALQRIFDFVVCINQSNMI